jgi:hypothetical protein
VGGGIILKWVFRKWDGEALTGLIWLRVGTVVGACECSNELLGCFLTSSGRVSFSGRTVLHGVCSLYIHIKKFEILIISLMACMSVCCDFDFVSEMTHSKLSLALKVICSCEN